MFLKACAMESAFFKMKDQCKVSCVRISLTVKNSENMVKSNACDEERQLLFEMCKSIDIFLTYQEVAIYLEYCAPHAKINVAKS